MFIDLREGWGEKRREKERKTSIKERNMDPHLPHTPYGDQAYNLSICSDRESNQ